MKRFDGTLALAAAGYCVVEAREAGAGRQLLTASAGVRAVVTDLVTTEAGCASIGRTISWAGPGIGWVLIARQPCTPSIGPLSRVRYVDEKCSEADLVEAVRTVINDICTARVETTH